jgi:hypothetical protein
MPDTNRTRYFDMNDSLIEFLTSEWRRQIALHAKAEKPSGFYIKTAPILTKNGGSSISTSTGLLHSLDLKSMSPNVKVSMSRTSNEAIIIEIDDRQPALTTEQSQV